MTPPATWKVWAGRTALAAADQGLVSGSNFLLSVLLARWLEPAAYGAYSLAFAVFLLVASFWQALLIEPMSVLGAGRQGGEGSEGSERSTYLGAILWLQAGFAAVTMALLGVGAAALGWGGVGGEVTNALAVLALAAPSILMLWVARSACYLNIEPGLAAGGALVYGACLLTGAWVGFQQGWLSPATALAVMAASSLVPGGLVWARLEARPGLGRGEVLAVWRAHWGYGRWALASAGVAWVPANIFYILAGAFWSMAHAGAMRAVMNLVMPVTQLAAASARLLLPYLAGLFGRQAKGAAREQVHRVIALLGAGAVIYCAAVSIFHRPIFALLYGDRWAEYSSLAPWATLGSVFWIASFGCGLGLRAMQAPSSEFVAQAATGVVSLVVGVPATWAFGLEGAVGALTIATMAAMAVSARLLRRKFATAG